MSRVLGAFRLAQQPGFREPQGLQAILLQPFLGGLRSRVRLVRSHLLTFLYLLCNSFAFPTSSHISDNRTIPDGGILRDDNYPVSNVVRLVFTVCFNNTILVQQPCIATDASILVDDCASDDTSLPYAYTWNAVALILSHVIERLVVVSAHHERSVDLHTFRDATAQTNHTIRNLCAVDDATFTHDRIVDVCSFNL